MLSELRHTQIQHMIQSTLGGSLTAQEKAELEAHLKECAECRSYQAQMLALDSSLKQVLHARMDRMQSQDKQRSERIVRRIKRRITFKNNLNFALYGAFLFVLFLIVLFAVQLVTQQGPQPVFPLGPFVSPIPSQAPAAARIIYVKADATGICNGPVNSWANPCSLTSALATASSGMQIWAMAGVYKPTLGTDREATFTLRSGVEIYGGFAGNETSLDQRDPKNVTILSGDIGTPNDAGNGRAYCDNSYHVVTGSGADATSILDGFTVTLGNAIGSSPNGGGMYIDGGSPTLRNLIFSDNFADRFGGGMANYNSNPSLTNVTFSDNHGYGGGMYNYNSSPNLTNVTFSNNLSGFGGGGMANDDGSNPNLTNVTFSGNLGGGMVNFNSSPILTNVTFWSNKGGYGGMGNFEGSHPTLVNVIMWFDNPEELINYSGSTPIITYSDIQQSQGVYPGTGNINADPLFVNAPFNLNLQQDSLAIDAGNNAAISTELTTDLDNKPRIFGGTVDMGAYEYYGP